MTIRRRDFIAGALAVGGAAAVAGGAYALLSGGGDEPEPESILLRPPQESPIDTIVVLMLENRSFDHYYGWLGSDETYLEAGRSRYGSRFTVNARTDERYETPDRRLVDTQYLLTAPDEPDPYRGCGHRIPGHTWETGRVQRDHGFLAEGSGNDDFAIGFYEAKDLPVHARLAERFTIFDQYHASLLAGTFPNRQYMHSAQSNGRKDDPVPLDVGIFQGPTIWDRLIAAGVDVGYYYVDLPVLLLWGEQYSEIVHSTDVFFEQAGKGKLPNVVFVDPGFGPPLRTDDHPLGDVRLGQRFVREIFKAFVRSPQWEHGAFFLVYDEWGGFFDHVPPPLLADARASQDDANNFGQAGFRVPAVLASPYGRHGGVDHRLYDHTSILRFLEWRFLGAPPEGPGKDSDTWFLTTRDRFANNIGRTLRSGDPDLELHYDADVPLQSYSLGCTPEDVVSARELLEEEAPFIPSAGMRDVINARYPRATETPWIDDKSSPFPTSTSSPPSTSG